MSVSAAQVKELREATGAPMMDCKKALEATAGDFERAIEELRKTGAAKAVKKANRVASDGIIVIRVSADGKRGVIIEVNCETDFVARDQNFLSFVNALADTALASHAANLDQLNQLTLLSQSISIEEARQTLVAKVGENVHIRRMVVIDNPNFLGAYLHGSRIGTLVSLEGGDQALAKDIAMHIAASKPLVVKPEEVSADIIAKEKEIYMAQAASSGKSQDIIEKMVNGRLKKYLDEVSLVGQPFIKEPDMTVQSLLNKHRAKVLSFTRYEVGEGIEKEKEDFVEAVRSQIQEQSGG